MKRRVFSHKGHMAVITGVLLVGVGQLGRIPLPARYYPIHARLYLTANDACAAATAADVVVLGDSRVLEGALPWVLSRDLILPGRRGEPARVASLAMAGAAPDVELWLWRRLASSRSRAKVVIAGITEISLSQGRPTRDYALRYLFRSRDAVWLLSRGRVADAATLLTYRLFPLWARRTAVCNLFHGQQPVIPRAAERRALRRAVLMVHARDYQGYRVDRFMAECLDQLVREARQHGVNVFLVAPPVARVLLSEAARTPSPRSQLQPAPVPRANSSTGDTPFDLVARIAGRCAARRGAIFLNYATSEQSGRFHYGDPAHLSARGAREFSHDLAGRINRELAREKGRQTASLR